MTDYLRLVPEPRAESDGPRSVTFSDLVNICGILGFDPNQVRRVLIMPRRVVVTLYHRNETGHLVPAPSGHSVLTYDVEVPVVD